MRHDLLGARASGRSSADLEVTDMLAYIPRLVENPPHELLGFRSRIASPRTSW